ncbi:hypothetical protein CORC01_01752 [Colletotrichum orchidophilum]|uniref:Uncharacterized protein n=1 Tax=Colletotrichum orchidophilum TaxID=1209926 RepID=A0A1G4BNK3_9PEZI|nr:uncharacterized protein CORC01_01752 [Colletotrichum orchidophilum]OHF02994.1 hypothetical protein CORC01_01752 [Colletotrichum orchidophilum]
MAWGVDDKSRRAGLESPRPPGPRVVIAPRHPGTQALSSESSWYSTSPELHGTPKTNRRLQGYASLPFPEQDHRAAQLQRKAAPPSNVDFLK